MPTIITRGAVSAKAYGFGVSGGYSVSKSLRFRSSASAYLNRTPASATNQTVWTLSVWVKRGTLSAIQTIFEAYTNGSNSSSINFTSSDQIQISNYVSGSLVTNKITSAVYRDPSAWYHIVVASNGSTSLNLYVNGSQVTAFGTNVGPTAANWFYNGANAHRVATEASGGSATQLFDGYLAEFNWIDGSALTPTSFGTYDANGVWQPIKYSGSFGTNGFYLNFGNTTSTTTLGYDTSGNNNNWTVNNISLTAGTTYDSMTDSPTVSSTSVANYAVMNPLATYSTVPTNGNLSLSVANNTGGGIVSTVGLPTTGKWYWEVTANLTSGGTNTNGPYIGIIPSTYNPKAGSAGSPPSTGYLYLGDGTKNVTGTASAYGSTWTDSTANTYVIGVAYDAGGGTITFYRNNTSQGTLASSIPASGYTAISGNAQGSAGACSLIYNFGQQPFTYTPPTGFNALNTYNLPTPTIANGAQYMAATTYTGTGATQTISDGGNNTIGTTFQPDLVWIKSRSATTNHNLFDVLRGTTAYLSSNSASAEATNANTLTAFGSTGFTVGSDASSIGVNVNAATYVGWQWKANGTGVSNTSGSITSTVSANTTAGFSVVTFTAPASGNFTVGHGLNASPAMMILKDRSAVVSWAVWHKSLSNPAQSYLSISNTNAAGANTTVWGNTAPTSTVMTLGVGGAMNASDATVAYCWSEIPGYSAFGSYTGNGSTDGPFIYTGFRPRFVLLKKTSAVGSWGIFDTSRDTYNVMGNLLNPDLSSAETSFAAIDFLSNGFKIRETAVGYNTSGASYIYAAFAENPLNYSRAR